MLESIYVLLLELFETLKCNFTIAVNKLPLYQILLVCYFASTAMIVTFVKNKYPEVEMYYFAGLLLTIWVIQIYVWGVAANVFYH